MAVIFLTQPWCVTRNMHDGHASNSQLALVGCRYSAHNNGCWHRMRTIFLCSMGRPPFIFLEAVNILYSFHVYLSILFFNRDSQNINKGINIAQKEMK